MKRMYVGVLAIAFCAGSAAHAVLPRAAVRSLGNESHYVQNEAVRGVKWGWTKKEFDSGSRITTVGVFESGQDYLLACEFTGQSEGGGNTRALCVVDNGLDGTLDFCYAGRTPARRVPFQPLMRNQPPANLLDGLVETDPSSCSDAYNRMLGGLSNTL